jgi:hypothetical protein
MTGAGADDAQTDASIGKSTGAVEQRRLQESEQMCVEVQEVVKVIACCLTSPKQSVHKLVNNKHQHWGIHIVHCLINTQVVSPCSSRTIHPWKSCL